MTRPLQDRTNNQRDYTSALQSIWNFSHQIVDPAFGLKRDIDIWRVSLRDGKVKQGVQQRLNNVAGPSWAVGPGDDESDSKELARLAGLALKKIRKFRDGRKNAAKGIFRGTSFNLIIGWRVMTSLGGGPIMNWWLPFKLKSIDKRRFMRQSVKVELEDGRIFTTSRLLMSVIDRRNDNGESGVSTFNVVKRPQLFLSATWDNDEDRLGFGEGLLDTLYFLTWVKGIVLREGLQGLERWAQGIVVQELDPDRPSDKTNEERRDDMLDELKRMKSRGVYVHMKGEPIQSLTGGSEGNAIVMDFLRYIDDMIIALSTGAVLASSSGSLVGSFARDKQGAEIQETVVGFDREKLDENITDDVIGLWMRMNRSNLAILELLNAASPEFHTSSEPIIDPAVQITIIAGAMNQGIPLKRSEVYERIQFTPPADDDEIFVPVIPEMDPDFTPEQKEGEEGVTVPQ